MIRIPISNQLRQLSFREQMVWASSLFWGCGLALFTIWYYIPYCKKKMREKEGKASSLYKIALFGSIVFFVYQLAVCGMVVWLCM